MGKDALSHLRLVIVSPVYEDATSVIRLVSELEATFASAGLEPRFLLVDDGSPCPLLEDPRLPGAAPHCVLEVLRLRRNVGHQRAISLAFAYLHEHVPCDAVLVMDADGEDRPSDALRFVEHYGATEAGPIIFAARTRRTESWLFMLLYRLYQVLHWLLTGIKVEVGNFSMVPARCLPTLVTLPSMWNHYAAAVFQSRLPFVMIPTERGRRYSGRSKMNYLALVMHGLHAISVFSDLVAVRLLIAAFGLSAACGGLLIVSLLTHVHQGTRQPGWTVHGWELLLFLLLLTVGCFSLLLNVLSQRNNLDFLPIRDWEYFVERATRVVRPHE